MKKPLAIICLFVILLQGTSALWILGSFYANRNYISRNVCINRFDAIPLCKGQCFLDRQLGENDQQARNFPLLKQKEVQLFFHEALIQDHLYTAEISETAVPRYAMPFYDHHFQASVFHPPQAARS